MQLGGASTPQVRHSPHQSLSSYTRPRHTFPSPAWSLEPSEFSETPAMHAAWETSPAFPSFDRHWDLLLHLSSASESPRELVPNADAQPPSRPQMDLLRQF